MVNAFQNIITITRGDDAQIVIDVTDLLGNSYDVKDGDVFTFYVKEFVDGASLESATPVITKVFNHETMGVEVTGTDTKALSTDKKYKYGVKLVTEGGKTQTVIVPTDFIVEGGIQ